MADLSVLEKMHRLAIPQNKLKSLPTMPRQNPRPQTGHDARTPHREDSISMTQRYRIYLDAYPVQWLINITQTEDNTNA